jgi:hypothetical protein
VGLSARREPGAELVERSETCECGGLFAADAAESGMRILVPLRALSIAYQNIFP